MHIEVDTHTHTVLSGHAQSTLLENAAAAAKIGLKGFVLSDHGPAIPGAPQDFNIGTYPFLPSHIENVRVYRGVEANVTDSEGHLDIKTRYLKLTDFVIAGMHEIVLSNDSRENDMAAALGALSNKYVDIIAHPDNPSYELDYETLVKETARMGKLLEVNNHSFSFRPGGMENAMIYLPLCVRYGVRVCVASDAHSCFEIGQHQTALDLLEEMNFPPELVVNRTLDSFEAYLVERKKRIG